MSAIYPDLPDPADMDCPPLDRVEAVAWAKRVIEVAISARDTDAVKHLACAAYVLQYERALRGAEEGGP